jgi:hypothetical protein
MSKKQWPAGASGGRGLDGRLGEATSHLDYITSVKVRRGDGRVVAEVQNGALVKRVKGSVHMLQKPRAWCCDVDILHQAEVLGATQVRIEDVETGNTYVAPLSRFWTRGFPVRRGHGEQRGLLLADWQVNGAPSRADAVQLSLLEVAA